MTPGGVHLEQLLMLGLVALFGGVLVHVPVALLVGRWKGGDAGITTGLLMFGLTGLAAAAAVASFVYLESAVVVLPRSGCEPLPAQDGEPRSQDNYLLPRPGLPPLKLVAPAQQRVCPEEAEPPVRLRVRRDELAARGAAFAMPEPDEHQAPAMIGVFAAFGGFAFLFGLGMLGGVLEDRRRARGEPEPTPAVVHPLLALLANVVTAAGVVAAVGGFFGAIATEETGPSFALVFGGPALLCGALLLAQLLRWRLTLSAFAGLLLGMLGFGAAALAGLLFI